MSLSSYRWAGSQVVRGISGAKGLFFLSVSLAATALSILVFLFSLALSLYEPILSIPLDPEITVFTVKDTPKAGLDNLVARVSRVTHVRDVRVIGKDAAYAELSESLGISSGKNPIGNPLPDIVIVSLEKDLAPEIIDAVAKTIRAFDGVDALSYDANWLAKLDSVTTALKTLLAVLSAATGLLVVLVLAASVRLNSEVQKSEMRLLYVFGATVGFAIRPYVWRGFLTMALASAVSVGFAALGVHFMNEGIAELLRQYALTIAIALPKTSWLAAYVASCALVGAGLAWLFARLSVRSVERGG